MRSGDSIRYFELANSLERIRMNANNDFESNPRASVDWHPADVLAALKKRGHSLAGLSIANGYHPTAAGKALKQAWPAVERIVADALGLQPQLIWPSRYDNEGLPLGRAKT
jgi:Ner family transcriptional regulator